MTTHLIPVVVSTQVIFNSDAPDYQTPEYQRKEFLTDIVRQLVACGVDIGNFKLIPHGVEICLPCGAFIRIYKTGKVVLEGKAYRNFRQHEGNAALFASHE